MNTNLHLKSLLYMQKRILKSNSISLPTASCAEVSTSIFHPLSHYILGAAVDVSGNNLRTDAQVVYDNVEDIEMMENGDIGITPLAACDPRVDFFDIREHASKQTTDEVTSKGISPQISKSELTE